MDLTAIANLDAVLDEAQNEPPEGAGDKTITPENWARLRALCDTAQAFNKARFEAKKARRDEAEDDRTIIEKA